MTTSPFSPTAAIPPKPGRYPNVGFADYARWKAWNQSTLKLMGRYDSVTGQVHPAPWASPAHALAQLQGQVEATPSQKLGSDYHAMLLEPERFDREYHVIRTKIDRRTTEGKARWATLTAQFGEDRLITPERWEELSAMCGAAAKHPEIKNLIKAHGYRELSLSWIDQETGAPCKARIDLLLESRASGKVYMPDVKTTRCSHWTVFEKDAANFGYHVQAAFYADGHLAATGQPVDDYLLIAQETSPPYPAVVYRVPPEALDSGRRIYRAMLKEALRCEKTGEWPGYADDRVVDLTLPSWAHADEAESIA